MSEDRRERENRGDDGRREREEREGRERREREGRGGDDGRRERRERDGRREGGSRREREEKRDYEEDYRGSRRHTEKSDRKRPHDFEERDGRRYKGRSESHSPPPPIKRKRASQWDVAPPPGYDAVVDNPSSTANLNNNMNPHLTRQARRLYVGNIPDGITELQLAEFFNIAFNKSGVSKNENPVIAVQMDTVKSFAFLEFGNQEDATAGMSFDGIVLQGNSLKIRRPKDYRPMGDAMLMEAYRSAAERRLSQLPNLVSTNVAEGPNKIFIGGLPAYLNEDQVKELISSFGHLKSFNLVKDSQTGNSKGFAFFEYMDADVTDKACQGLNGMKLGDKTILVQRASLGAKHLQPHNPILSSGKSILFNETAKYFLNLGMPIAAAAALLGVSINNPGPPSPILQIANVISSEQTLDDDEYEDIKADIKDECRNYGAVISIKIPRSQKKNDEAEWVGLNPEEEAKREQQKKEEDNTPQVEWGVGKAFVEFASPADAAKAQVALAGRKFNNRHILTGFYSEMLYIQDQFSCIPEEERDIAERHRMEREKREMTDRAVRNLIETSKQGHTSTSPPPPLLPNNNNLPSADALAQGFLQELKSEQQQEETQN